MAQGIISNTAQLTTVSSSSLLHDVMRPGSAAETLQCSWSGWQLGFCFLNVRRSGGAQRAADKGLLLLLLFCPAPAAATAAAVLTLKVVICPLAAAYILKCLRSVEAPLADKMPTAPLASILEMGIKFVAAKAD
jgi:hypothetical protein